MNGNERYLGDAVYATHDGWMLCLTVDKGSPNERQVWLEPRVLQNLIEYAEREQLR